MTSQQSLIVSAAPVPRIRFGGFPPVEAHVAVVYVGPGGAILRRNGRKGFPDRRLFPAARMRYEVDTGDHHRLVELRTNPLPARGEAYFFQAWVEVGFRVSDPEAVVRRHVEDGLTIVTNYLAGEFRKITRQFDIKDSEAAERAINQQFADERRLPEGISIYLCSVRLMPDAAARGYLAAKTEALRKEQVNVLEHQVAEAVAEHENKLKAIAHEGERSRRKKMLEELAGHPTDPYYALMMHLADHPDDTQGIFELLLRVWERSVEREDARDDRAMAMLRHLLSRGVIQSVDVERFRDELTGRVRDAASQQPASIPLLPGWEGGPVLPPIRLGRSTDQPPHAGNGASRSPEPESPRSSVVWPVYVLVEESVGLASHLGQLGEALRTLRRDIAMNPRLTDLVRLTVLGFADTVEPRSLSDDPARNGSRPTLRAREGVRYGPAFRKLLDLIPQDIGRLKASGTTVARPVVYFLSGSRPDDDATWLAARQELVSQLNATAPHIIACGVDAANAEDIATVATHPELAYVPGAGMDTAEALAHFARFVEKSVLESADTLLTNADRVVGDPVGFRMAGAPRPGSEPSATSGEGSADD